MDNTKRNSKVPVLRFPGFEKEWEEKSFGELYEKHNVKNDLSFGVDIYFDKAPKKQQAEVIAMYLDTLKDQYADLEKEIKDDPILQDIEDTIEFRTGILKGDIKLNKEEAEEEKK